MARVRKPQWGPERKDWSVDFEISSVLDLPCEGIAVSGGLDSMALARLCVGPKNNNKHSVDLHAFIVDHRARAGSADDAKLVASWLQGWGMISDLSR